MPQLSNVVISLCRSVLLTFSTVFHSTVVDCGTPLQEQGATFNPATPDTLYQSTFIVNCKPGYVQKGSTNHRAGSNVVECGSNGSWMFGTLRCGMLVTLFADNIVILGVFRPHCRSSLAQDNVFLFRSISI